MAAVFGKVEEFDSDKDDWLTYVERVNHFFKANSITGNEQKQAVFLSVIGPSTYKLLKSLLAPEKPGDKPYKDLVKKLTEHFNPTPSEIVQRFKFHGRFRKQGESVATYVAELRCLAEFCNFGSTLEDMLRDQLVWGISNDAIQQRLLQEAKLTYKRAVELAQGLETAAQNVKTLKTHGAEPAKTETKASASVHKVANKGIMCHRCGKAGHIAPKCHFKDTICHKCGKKGHLKAVCRSKPKGNPSRKRQPRHVRHIEEEEVDDESEDELTLYHIRAKKTTPPLRLSIKLNEHMVEMELDTGASVLLMSETTFRRLWPQEKLAPSQCRLCSYSKEPIPVLGSFDIVVSYKDQQATLPLIVVEGEGPTLLGRNWLDHIVLDWKEIHLIRNAPLQAVLEKHKVVFEEQLGKLKGFEAKILVDPEATPRFCKARSVPLAMREKVEEELQRLVQEGVLEPVEFASWAAPTVTVLKADKKSVRLCGDFRLTVNPVAKLDRYPIPKIDDLFAKLAGGRLFTKIDLSQAYQQIPLDETSKSYAIINTHKGLFRYTRLPYGISSAPGIFQRVIESVLQGISGVMVYIDDILVTGATQEEHLRALDAVLTRLENANLRARMKKCSFMVPSVDYLGYRLSAEGVRPVPSKVKAIKEAPVPSNVTELKAYLGLLTYYGKFLPKLSTTLAPLYVLLRKDTPWEWTDDQEKAFNQSKGLLTSSSLLVHFDPKLKLTLTCDASAYGIGAVLAHVMPDGSKKPIGYASRSLTSAERNYSQLEKEGLACVFGVKKFHDYVFGHPFELVTDHKPLITLLSEYKATSAQASARIRRWSLTLAAYEYHITFRKTEEHSNADALSRLPLAVTPAKEEAPPELVLLTEQLAELPVTAEQIASFTRRDPSLFPVLQCLQEGWPEQCDATLTPYFSKRNELSIHQGCILWGSRVVVPKAARKVILYELHNGHWGMSRMKSLTRMFVWWPGLDSDIEQMVRKCEECQSVQSSPPLAPLHPWKWPTRPWSRLHLDFAGPLFGKMFLILIDSHSKWIEAFCTTNATASTVIEALRSTFARFGLPDTVVSDNGPCFISQEFRQYLQQNGIKQITAAPYHPATNGLAERAVQVIKRGLKKVKDGSIQTRISRILFTYCITPQSTTGVSPAELLMGRRPKSRLDLLKPNVSDRVEKKQYQHKQDHDRSAKSRVFSTGQQVYVKNNGAGSVWLRGTIIETTGPVSFRVKLEDGREWQCHQDHLRQGEPVTQPVISQDKMVASDFATDSSTSESDITSATDGPGESEDPDAEDSQNQSAAAAQTDSPTARAYPTRVRLPPQRFEPNL